MSVTFDELKLTGSLPSPAGVGMNILRLTQTDDFTAEDLARTIQSDPALTGRIIKMANSAATAGVVQITSVSEAVVRLGVRTVRNVALGFSLVSSYRKGKCQSFDYPAYWSSSLARAVAAQALARELRLIQPAEAYICGLLSGIGRLALASVHPKSYSELLDRLGRHVVGAPLAEAEREVFGIDHHEIAAAMLADWKLPEAHSQALAVYHQPIAEDVEGSRAMVALRTVLRVVSPIADIFLSEQGEHARHWDRFVRASELVEAGVGRLSEICDEVVAEWRDWGNVLAVPTQPVPPFAEIAEMEVPNDDAAPPEGESPAPVADIDATSTSTVDDEGLLQKLVVLAVDDDPISLRLLVAQIEKNGYEAVQATNGAEALERALESNPHIVVTDWLMPEMDGVELCRALRRTEIGSDMYVLLLTGREDEENAVEAFDAGVDDFIVKPFNPKILKSRMSAGERIVRLKDKVADDKRKIEEHVAHLAVLNRKLTQTTVTDALTDIPNRRFAMEALGREWDRRDADQSGAVSVVMVDIDHFKRVNDDFGHDVGDSVLKQVAALFRDKLRQGDTVCRLGGEEFLIVCPGSDLEGARIVAERLRAAVEETEMEHGTFRGRITCSFGVAERTRGMDSIDDLLKAADVAVYAAKDAGRNTVCRAPAPATA
ncbi:MAG: HDOD domain-containing protein [Planctomycetota bacterium JB042]